MNLASTPLDNARHELTTVNLQLMHVIEHARRWHDIKKAADAMFHARLIWESTYRELYEQATEAGASSHAGDRSDG